MILPVVPIKKLTQQKNCYHSLLEKGCGNKSILNRGSCYLLKYHCIKTSSQAMASNEMS